MDANGPVTFRMFLSDTVIGVAFAATLAAVCTAIAFSHQALTFLGNQFRKGVRSPYTQFLATGIFLCSSGLACTFINVLLILLGLTGSPVLPGANLVAVSLAIAGYGLMGAGYCLHLIAWHATQRKEGKVFPWQWSCALATAMIVGTAAVWEYR